MHFLEQYDPGTHGRMTTPQEHVESTRWQTPLVWGLQRAGSCSGKKHIAVAAGTDRTEDGIRDRVTLASESAAVARGFRVGLGPIRVESNTREKIRTCRCSAVP